MNHLDEIRSKISIEELVGQYIQLKKAGRNLKGLCPFHNDSRPSLMVSPEKGIAYWVEDAGSQYIFILSPSSENLALLTSLSAGTTATR